MYHQVERAVERVVALHRSADEHRQLAEDDQHCDPEQERLHHRVRDEAREPPEPEQPGRNLQSSGKDDEQREGGGALVARETGQRLAGGQGGGARRRDDHLLCASRQSADDRAGHRCVGGRGPG
jgi:hypothetical protein